MRFSAFFILIEVSGAFYSAVTFFVLFLSPHTERLASGFPCKARKSGKGGFLFQTIPLCLSCGIGRFSSCFPLGAEPHPSLQDRCGSVDAPLMRSRHRDRVCCGVTPPWGDPAGVSCPCPPLPCAPCLNRGLSRVVRQPGTFARVVFSSAYFKMGSSSVNM